MSLALAGVRAALTPKWVSDDLWKRAGQVPAFHLDFTTGQAIERISGRLGTFTRPSSVKRAWDGSQFAEFAADVPALQRDPVTGLWGYLHEPAATNLYLNSATPATQSIAVSAVQYTLSFYGTGTLTLSGASTAGPLVGTGAEPNRVSLTFTPSAGTLTLTLTGSISRPQLETGPVATSPIVTTGSAVTRNADTWTWTGSQFSDWYNQAGGVFVWRGIPLAQPSFPGFAAWSDGTNANRIQLGGQDALFRYSVITASLVQAAITSVGSFVLGQRSRMAARCLQNDAAVSANGSGLGTDTSVTLPTLNTLRIGSDSAGGSVTSQLIQDVLYFPPGPAADRIQQLSAL
jgi:hypothetical protein